MNNKGTGQTERFDGWSVPLLFAYPQRKIFSGLVNERLELQFGLFNKQTWDF